MSGAGERFAFLGERIADPGTQWSFGTFGAIAEFARDGDEPAVVSGRDGTVSSVTARGGIRIAPVAGMRPFASETMTRESWNQRVALCLPADRCAMNRRDTLTELGPDAGALREQDRDAILFDLGLDALQVDACIRVSDPEVVSRLRGFVGQPIFAPGNQAMAVILPANPHRVFVSRLGRAEVFQGIPPPDGTSPEGPHTHVLPRLLAHRRTHAATEPVPEGFVPCAHLYPAHPAKDGMGHKRPFDGARHEAFQHLLRAFGDPEAVALKQKVVAAVAAGAAPPDIAIPDDRFARAGVRVALRQLTAAGAWSPVLPAWIATYERLDPAAPDMDEPADPYGHHG